jgi:undecaprenyl-diphosphatase
VLKSDGSTIVAPFPRRRPALHAADILRTPGLLGAYPGIGLIMILLGGGSFGVLAYSLQTHAPLIQTDIQLAGDLHRIALQSAPFVRGLMIFGFYVGEHAIFAIGAGLVLFYIYKRCWAELSMVVITWCGELVILFVTSAYFHRPRPLYDVSVWRDMPSPGFPSGHSISAVMCYGLLAYFIVPRLESHFWRVVVIAAAVLIVLFVGFSRVFVGDHYPVDILAGYALGVAWSGLVYTSVELISGRKQNRLTT